MQYFIHIETLRGELIQIGPFRSKTEANDKLANWPGDWRWDASIEIYSDDTPLFPSTVSHDVIEHLIER